VNLLPNRTVYRQNHNTYNIHVDETPDKHYLLVYSNNVLIGNGNIIHSYKSQEDAVYFAKIFPDVYKIAQENGFTLQKDKFYHHKKGEVFFSYILDRNLSINDIKNIFAQL
jgi:hypothetical protein